MIPPTALRRVARRYDLGAEKHGEGNWLQSLTSEENALAFCKEAYNHLVEHQMKMQGGLEPGDDHLAAIGWAVFALMAVEEKYGKPWTELTR